jgi:hypothetical protein
VGIPTAPVHLSVQRRQPDARTDLAHGIIRAVRLHVQWKTLAGCALKRGGLSAAISTASAFLVLLAALPYTAQSDWTPGAEASVRHDDNVGNAQSYSDIVADTTIGARLSIFQLFPVGEEYSVTVGGGLSGESFHSITGLNNASLDGVMALKRKWGVGAFAPWARAGISLARTDYDDSYRNAWIYRATLASGRRIDERWNLWAEYALERRAASAQMEEVPGLSGDAYSQDSQSIRAHLEYSLNGGVILMLGLSARHGDVVSTTEGSAAILAAARALAADPAFGPEAYAYRLTGTTYGFRVGVNYSPTPHSMFGCGFERFDTRADGGIGYTKSIPEITWNYSF